jgi:hypothetical protein
MVFPRLQEIKIASKVRGSQENSVRRKSLLKYRDLLLKQFEEAGIQVIVA